MLKVLFLTPWYPSEKDAMIGLFVQKHVEAVRAQGVEVRVIHSQSLWDTVRQYKKLQKEGWTPDIVQLNVIQKQGLLAVWLKKRYHIPYVIIEHWTGYLPESKSVRPKTLHTQMMRYICREAEIVMPVSKHLGEAMRALGFKAKRWEKINNVVDDFFFEQPKPEKKNTACKVMLNITCFDEPHKNVKGLLRAAKELSEKRRDWRLVLVGTGVDYKEVRAYADSLGFPGGMLEWRGELKPQQVSDEFDRADIFVLTSRFENAPVVISESIVKGVPVVSTNVGGISEMVNEQSGILVPSGDEEALVAAMNKMLDNYSTYNHEHIRKAGSQYSFSVVGAQLTNLYHTCAQG